MTAEDVANPVQQLPTWPEIENAISQAERAAAARATDAGLLMMWVAFEGMLRRRSADCHLTAERLPASALLKHLYSNGELSMRQFNSALTLLKVRNRTAHGYKLAAVPEAPADLRHLVDELLHEWKT